MLLLIDIGNTNTHVGLANEKHILRQIDIPTATWFQKSAGDFLKKLLLRKSITGAAVCSVVPAATTRARQVIEKGFGIACLELTHKNVTVGIDYPKPETIGPDRLANAVAVQHHFGSPSVVVDFGTAVTFDVVDRRGRYVGGIIAPGLAAMTDYLHEKTALLPKIKIREVRAVVGKNTEEAMLVGAVHGYRGLVRELISELKRELKTKKLAVVATGGYAKLISAKLPEIAAVKPELTLEGLRLVWLSNQVREPRGGEKVCYLKDSDL